MPSPLTLPETSPPELSPQRQFQLHYRLAEELRDSCRYTAAAEQYQLALKTSGGRQEERLEAQHELGCCIGFLGRLPETLEALNVIYQETWHCPEFYRLAYRALYHSIDGLLAIQQAADQEEGAPLRRRLALIEEGLRWLRAIDKASWRSALLLHKADTLWALGERTAALAEAEAAFQLNRQDQNAPGFALAEHGRQVGRFARQLGEPQRGLQAIETLGGRYGRPSIEARICAEKVHLLLALDPPQRQKALREARRGAHLAKEIQFPLAQLEVYAALSQSALALARFSQAEAGLRQIYLLALENTTFNRPYLLREAKQACQKAQGRLTAGELTSRAQKLQSALTQWCQEFDQALADHSGHVSEGEG